MKLGSKYDLLDTPAPTPGKLNENKVKVTKNLITSFPHPIDKPV